MRLAAFILIAFAFCIALAPATFADTYWTVVADDGKASDVVAAANFAASMKASAGISFSGRTDSQVDAAMEDSDSLMTVRLSDGSATIFAGDEIDDSIVDIARTYLVQQGFRVSMSGSAPSSGGSASATPQQQALAAKNLPDDEPQAAPVDDTVSEPADIATETPAQEPADAGPDTDLPADAPREAPGVFARLWRWLADLFS